MARVVERVPLIVACRVGAHPRRHRLALRVRKGVAQVARVTGELVQQRRAEFHVVDPVVLLVEVRRAAGRGLADAGIALAQRVGGHGLVAQRIGEGSVAVGEEARAQRERRRHLAGSRRVAGRAIPVLQQALRLAGAGVHRTFPALPPSVVGTVGRDEVEERMVPVIPELVEHRAVVGEHARQPIQAMSRLVEHIGSAVPPRQSDGSVRIAEGRRCVAPRRQQVIGGGGRRGDILQVVGRIGPAAAHRQQLAGARGMVDDDAVESMRGVAQERIVPRTLLAHVGHERVGQAVECVGGDAQRGRRVVTGANAIATRRAKRGEVEAIRLGTRAETAAARCRGRAEHRATALRLDREAGDGDRCQRAQHRHLGRVREVADLVDADERDRVGRRRARGSAERGEEDQSERPRQHTHYLHPAVPVRSRPTALSRTPHTHDRLTA